MKLHNPFKPITIGRAHENVNYMLRWMLLPKNNWFNIYLHKFVGDDDITLGLHDHPWNWYTLVLSGGYKELQYSKITDGDLYIRKHYRPGDWTFRSATFIHAVQLHRRKGKPLVAWTLNFTFKRKRQWGFWKDGVFTSATHYYPHEERIT